MKNRTLHDITAKVDNVFLLTEKVAEDEVKAIFAKYLCVLSSGYLEESIRIIINNYVITKSHPYISSYVLFTTKNLTNYNTEKICKLLNVFNPQWREKFESNITVEEKDAIDSVLANRHQIVHGRDVGVSYIHIKNWYIHIKRTIQVLNVIVNN